MPESMKDILVFYYFNENSVEFIIWKYKKFEFNFLN